MGVLDTEIKFLAGIGPKRAELLEKELGILSIGDLLRHYPFRYIDRTKIYSIGELNENMNTSLVQLRARVTGIGYAGSGRKQRFSAFVSDSTGSAELIWFQGIKWIEKRIEVGDNHIKEVLAYG